ncbi:MAG: hypothetical protein U0800_15790 [Isosphaeraceae bacterium]
MTLFAALARDYAAFRGLTPADAPRGRMIALAGDAELDEGNIFEALLEGWKHDVRDLWWIIDYNRQSLDSVVQDRLFARFDSTFRAMGWEVITLKYGRMLQRAFERPGGDALRDWIDNCPNSLYSALVYRGTWREHLRRDLGGTRGIAELLDEHDDAGLHALMTNLAGHDLGSILEAYDRAGRGDAPACILAYTIKGYGLPLAGHKDNHSGLMTADEMDAFRRSHAIEPGDEYEPYAGLGIPGEEIRQFLARAPFAMANVRRHESPAIAVPEAFEAPRGARLSTQEGFGRLLHELAGTDGPLADRIVTTSPDVTVSTGLGPWVNRRGVFGRLRRSDVFRDQAILSAQRWEVSPEGQHIELGIAENNLFLLLAALGLAGPMLGARLLPIGTLYDPFICRGLDALNYACYQDARFLLVATPSGISLAPEGGAHQSVSTPLIGLGQPGLTAFEPAFVDELATILPWALRHIQEDGGGSVYLRLSTRPIDQPDRGPSGPDRGAILEGGYWLEPPGPGADLAIACSGAVAPEAIEALSRIREDVPGAGLMVVTSAGRLHEAWSRRLRGEGSDRPAIARLLDPLDPGATLITVLDGHPATLSWLGAVAGHRVVPLGVDRFGQSGDIPDLYRAYGIDADAILKAAARACLYGGR